MSCSFVKARPALPKLDIYLRDELICHQPKERGAESFGGWDGVRVRGTSSWVGLAGRLQWEEV